MDESVRHRQQRRNHPSSSSSTSSSTGPPHFRSQKFSSNPDKTTQSSNFVPRSTTTTVTTPSNTRNPGYVPRWKSETNANKQQEGEKEAGEDVGSIVRWNESFLFLSKTAISFKIFAISFIKTKPWLWLLELWRINSCYWLVLLSTCLYVPRADNKFIRFPDSSLILFLASMFYA